MHTNTGCDVSNSLKSRHLLVLTWAGRALTNTTRGEEIRRAQSSPDETSPQEGQTGSDRKQLGKNKTDAKGLETKLQATINRPEFFIMSKEIVEYKHKYGIFRCQRNVFHPLFF